MSEDQLRKAYSVIVSRRGRDGRAECVPAEQLLAVVEERNSDGTPLELLDHVMGCGACREEFELLRAIYDAKRSWD